MHLMRYDLWLSLRGQIVKHEGLIKNVIFSNTVLWLCILGYIITDKWRKSIHGSTQMETFLYFLLLLWNSVLSVRVDRGFGLILGSAYILAKCNCSLHGPNWRVLIGFFCLMKAEVSYSGTRMMLRVVVLSHNQDLKSNHLKIGCSCNLAE